MWTSTSDTLRARWRARRRAGEYGFSLIEILLGLSLALCLALGVAHVWVSFQSLGVREGDETIWTLQGRVAGARLERDLRLAGTQQCPFATGAALLQASPSQVVVLVTAPEWSTPRLVEWELVNGALMRRWGACPTRRPATFSHSLYADNKTMLENVDTSLSRFSYADAGSTAPAALQAGDLPLVDTVAVELIERKDGTTGGAAVRVLGPVGR